MTTNVSAATSGRRLSPTLSPIAGRIDEMGPLLLLAALAVLALLAAYEVSVGSLLLAA